MSVGGWGGERDAGRREAKPPRLFPSEFHDIKKIPGSGRKHIQGRGGVGSGGPTGEPRSRASESPAAAEAKAKAKAKPGGPRRIARGSGRAGFRPEFRFGASFTPVSRTTNPPSPPGGSGGLAPWTSPQPPRNSPGGVRPEGRGALGSGGRGVGRPGPAPPETAGGGEVPAGCPSRPARARRALRLSPPLHLA